MGTVTTTMITKVEAMCGVRWERVWELGLSKALGRSGNWDRERGWGEGFQLHSKLKWNYTIFGIIWDLVNCWPKQHCSTISGIMSFYIFSFLNLSLKFKVKAHIDSNFDIFSIFDFNIHKFWLYRSWDRNGGWTPLEC